MKELSIEEKAKAYDEALKQIKECTPDENGFITIYPQEIFPELKESEGERIRKEIISAVNLYCTEYLRGDKVKKDMLAWLEKRGEKKIVDKVEPKFKVGDWVVSPNGVYWHIDAINNNRYEVSSTDGARTDWSLNTSLYHLWTIQDAKEGDVLYSLDSCRPFIYKERKQFEQATAYCGINEYGKFFVRNTKDCIIVLDKYIPATKEQRDLLFKEIKEAGYEWDAEKKELKKIEQKLAAWSEEDEAKLKSIL